MTMKTDAIREQTKESNLAHRLSNNSISSYYPSYHPSYLHDIFSTSTGTGQEEGVATHHTFGLKVLEKKSRIQAIGILLCDTSHEVFKTCWNGSIACSLTYQQDSTHCQPPTCVQYNHAKINSRKIIFCNHKLFSVT